MWLIVSIVLVLIILRPTRTFLKRNPVVPVCVLLAVLGPALVFCLFVYGTDGMPVRHAWLAVPLGLGIVSSPIETLLGAWFKNLRR